MTCQHHYTWAYGAVYYRKLSLTCENVTAVLVEPSTKLSNHLCLAHSLSPLTNGADVVLQVMNISPTPVTVYKGM